MKKKYYFPTTAPERVIWLNNFAAKISGYASAFGISAAEVSAIIAMAVFYSYLINFAKQAKKFKEDITKFIGLLSFASEGTPLGPMPAFTPAVAPPVTTSGIFTFIGGIVQRIKSNKAEYTEGIGEDLGIVGDEQVFPGDDFQSEITAKAVIDGVKITFTKNGVDGANVYGNPIGGTDPLAWEKLGFDMHSPYFDTRPLAKAGTPEDRRYMVRGVLDDMEVGKDSKVVQVTFSPATIASSSTTVTS